MHSRRRLLGFLGGGMLAVGGCLGVPGRSRPVVIPWVRLVNERETGLEIRLRLEGDGQRVFAETYRLGPVGSDRATVDVKSPVDGAGRYAVRAATDEDSESVDAPTLVFGDQQCVGVRFTVRADGTLDQWHYSTDEC
jgi:hypothetical protein